MPQVDRSRATWRTSSYSSQSGNCVEIADNLPAIIAVRDSKDQHGPVLAFDRHDWQTFIRQIKDE